jgi:hypothetical protein
VLRPPAKDEREENGWQDDGQGDAQVPDPGAAGVLRIRDPPAEVSGAVWRRGPVPAPCAVGPSAASNLAGSATTYQAGSAASALAGRTPAGAATAAAGAGAATAARAGAATAAGRPNPDSEEGGGAVLVEAPSPLGAALRQRDRILLPGGAPRIEVDARVDRVGGAGGQKQDEARHD